MPSPTGSSVAIEKRIDVRILGRLGTVLATQLGAVGLGGSAIAERMEASVEAECVVCGIGVTGADLMSVALASEDGKGQTEKQRRLRLGSCARKTCQSDFYTVRLFPVPGLDWNTIWEGIEAGMTRNAAVRVERRTLVQQFWPLIEPRLRQLGRPVPLAVLAVIVLILWGRLGFFVWQRGGVVRMQPGDVRPWAGKSVVSASRHGHPWSVGRRDAGDHPGGVCPLG